MEEPEQELPWNGTLQLSLQGKRRGEGMGGKGIKEVPH